MDIADKAQTVSALFDNLALANRHFDLTPTAAARLHVNGTPLCVECDVDIAARRQIIPNTQRCAECQEHADRSRK